MFKEIKTIVILGNGFDISHSIPSGYNDFKKYLQEKYGFCEKDCWPNIHSDMGNRGRVYVCEEESAKALFYGVESSFDNNWSGFEQDLAHMNFTEIIPTLDEFVSIDSEDDYSHYAQVYENYKNNFLDNIDLWKIILT